jgi:hypothetical protein
MKEATASYTDTLNLLYKRLLDETTTSIERTEIEFQIFVLVRGVNLPALRERYQHLVNLRESFLANNT